MTNTSPKESSASLISLNAFIDHTLLKPDATEQEIVKLCQQAREHHFFSVCVSPCWVSLATAELSGSSVIPITVIGFHEGNYSTEEKVKQTQQAVAHGAKEVDMVLNRDWLLDHRYSKVFEDIRAVVNAASGNLVKVILETSELTRNQKITAISLCVEAGAGFVKTSTGFSKSGATVSDISLMRYLVGENFGVKASGGIRTREIALEMVSAGATRLGTSASVSIVTAASVTNSSGGY